MEVVAEVEVVEVAVRMHWWQAELLGQGLAALWGQQASQA